MAQADDDAWTQLICLQRLAGLPTPPTDPVRPGALLQAAIQAQITLLQNNVLFPQRVTRAAGQW